MRAESVRHELDKILASEAFVNAERLCRFLRFTVEETLAGRADQIKEYRLGLEVFDRHASYDPRTDPIVRVEAGRLRAKLGAYYDTDGLADPVLIEFRKGGYAPSFHQRQPAPARVQAWRERKVLGLGLALLLAALAGYRGLTLSRQVRSLEGELALVKQGLPEQELAPIWGPFFAPGAQNTVVFGSPVFFNSERYRLFVRSPGINQTTRLSENREFRALQERFGDLGGPRYDYASMGDALALQRLTAFFGRGGRALKAVPAHWANWESIASDNLIFLGAPRMNPLLERLPYRLDFQVGPPDTYVYNLNPQPGEEKVYTTPSHRDALTYAIVAWFPGLQPNRQIMLLSAHQTSGLLAAVKYLTQVDTVRAIVEKLQPASPGERRHFQMLLRVIAAGDEPVKTEYVTHHMAASPGRQP